MQPSPFCSYFLDIEKELENVEHTTHVLKTLIVKQFLDRTTSVKPSCVSYNTLESVKSCPAKLDPGILVKKRQVYPVRFDLDLNFTHRYHKT